MFNNNSRKIDLLLTELQKDMMQVSAATLELNKSVSEIYDIVYKNSDSIQNRLLLISGRLDNMVDDVTRNTTTVKEHEERIDRIEKVMDSYITDREKKDKLWSMVLSAALAFIVPVSIVAGISVMNNSIVSDDIINVCLTSE